MSKIDLDKEHRFAIIGICWIMVIVMGSISFYLENPYWIIVSQIGIIVFAIYGFYLFMLFMYEYIEDKAWKRFQEELEELKKE